jgi:hypothetical protein
MQLLLGTPPLWLFDKTYPSFVSESIRVAFFPLSLFNWLFDKIFPGQFI